MNSYVTFYHLAMVTSLLVSVAVALLMWRYRRYPGAWNITALAGAVFLWTACFLLEANSTTVDGQLFFTGIAYIGSMSVPPLWFIFSYKYVVGDGRLSRKHLVHLFILPLVVIILVWTNNWHHIMWNNIRLTEADGFILTLKDYRFGFWIALTYNYILVGVGMGLLIHRLFVGTPLFKRQAISLIVAMVLPLLWNIIFVFDIFGLPHKDLTPVMFAFSGLALGLGFVRFQLMKVVPFAYGFVIRGLKDGILLFNREGVLIEANDSACRMVGIDNRSVGHSIAGLVGNYPLLSKVKLQEGNRVEAVVQYPGGVGYYEVESVALHEKHGRLAGWSVSIHDITSRKIDEQRLAEAYAREQELRRSLEAEVQKRAKYARALVHELKTPLTPIIATSEIMMTELREEPWARMARNIHRGGRNLNRKVDELLDLARSEIGTLKVDVTDIFPSDIMEDAVREMQPAAELRKQRLEVQIETPLPAIKADKARLRQVICNLVDNAFKFSRDEGCVVLRARYEDDRLVVEVEDNGPGLTETEQSRLFQIYERTDTDRRRLSGLGLGLALSKSLVELHGGTIWVKSRKDSGSTFGFAVPAKGPVN